jgi:hypothetical protein
MGDILSLSKKVERGLRNHTGFHVTFDELESMIQEDILAGIFAAKLRKLTEPWPSKSDTKSATTGSRKGETANRLTSGKLPDIPRSLDRSYIAALSAKA